MVNPLVFHYQALLVHRYFTLNLIYVWLMLLKDYENTMDDNKAIKVDRLEYERERTIDREETDAQGYFISSALQTAEYDADGSYMHEQQCRGWRCDYRKRGARSNFWLIEYVE